MPVISFKGKGDICFNMDIIELEFYISKEKLLYNPNLDKLIKSYANNLNIYEFEDCTIDLYKIGDNRMRLLEKISKCPDDKIGISIDCSEYEMKEIINHFNIIYNLLF